MLGDYEIVEALADALVERLPKDADALMTAEVKSIPLAHALAVRMQMPYVVARKARKPYMLRVGQRRGVVHHDRRAADAVA